MYDIGNLVRLTKKCAGSKDYPSQYLSGQMTFNAPQPGLDVPPTGKLVPEGTTGEVVAVHFWELHNFEARHIVIRWPDGRYSILNGEGLERAFMMPPEWGK